jgi:hypothetical protein
VLIRQNNGNAIHDLHFTVLHATAQCNPRSNDIKFSPGMIFAALFHASSRATSN